MTTNALGQYVKRVAWAALIALSAYYLYRAINYRFIIPGRLGPDLFNKQLWYFTHLITALLVVELWLSWIPLLRSRAARSRRS